MIAETDSERKNSKYITLTIRLNQEEDRMLNLVRENLGIRNKSDVVRFLIKKYHDEVIENDE